MQQIVHAFAEDGGTGEAHEEAVGQDCYQDFATQYYPYIFRPRHAPPRGSHHDQSGGSKGEDVKQSLLQRQTDQMVRQGVPDKQPEDLQ